MREQQAQLAREAGVEGFCYWHYWFGNGKRILDRPFREVLNSGKPAFPFCLGWANESWSSKSWTNKSPFTKDNLLLEQTYSTEDYIEHFKTLLPAFKDKRYITVDGKPLFYVYRPLSLPNPREFVELWHGLAIENGLPGIHIVAMSFNTSFREIGKQGRGLVQVPSLNNAAGYYKNLLDMGFDAVNARGNARAEFKVSGRYWAFIRTGLAQLFKIKLTKNIINERSTNTCLLKRINGKMYIRP